MISDIKNVGMSEKCLFNVSLLFLYMRWPLISYRIVLAIFAIVILVISVLCVIPVASQDITVDPQQESMDWDVDNDTISASGNIWINNSGYFDLKDIKLDMHLSTLDELYINSTKNVGNIAVGEDKNIKLDFSKDTDEISDEVKDHLINNQTDVNIKIKLKGGYSYSFLKFDIQFEDILEWDGLINDINFRYEDGTFEEHEDGLRFEVPVDVDTNDMLEGNINVDVSMYNEDETKLYDTAQEEFDLGTPETLLFTFDLNRNEVNEFVNTTQDIVFISDIDLENTGFSHTVKEVHTWQRILNSYTIHYNDAEITTDSLGNPELTVPMDISTNENDFIYGDIIVDVGMYDESEYRYSGTDVRITLGIDQSAELNFGLSDDDAKELATNSQTLFFKSTITIEEYDYTLNYADETYNWGAPLDGLEISSIRYSGNEAFADIAFGNDSPYELDLTLDVDIFNSAGTLVGETQESYLVQSGESIDDTLSATLSGVPDYAVVTITDNTSGYEYEEEVDVYEQ